MDEQFAKWTRRRRQALALTQEDLAERAGLSVRTVRSMESRRGANPSARTRRAVIAILGSQEQAPSSLPAPAQLPADLAVFVGREDEPGELEGRLRAPTSTPLIVLVTGPAGVGKTALAVRLGHRVRDHFAGRQIYLDLRGHDPDRPMTPEEALVRLLEALGVPQRAIPLDAAARAATRPASNGQDLGPSDRDDVGLTPGP